MDDRADVAAEHPRVAWAHVTVDCQDPDRVATFWSHLLEARAAPRPDGWFVLGPTVAGGPMIYFQPVSDPKVGKARAHLDLWVDDLDAAMARAEELGATSTGEIHDHPGGTLVVMGDPEGHEFCLIAVPGERHSG